MKKAISILGGALLALCSTQAATITISNYSSNYDGFYGIADNTGALVSSGSAATGVMGRMTLTDQQISDLAATNNIAALSAGFVPFDPVNGTFALNSVANGAFESSETFDTRASVNTFGGSPIYVWIYKGVSRTTATEYLLFKLNSNFPTDSEVEPPEGPVPTSIRLGDVAIRFAGDSGPQTHDYGLGGGALPIYKMFVIPGGGNLPPVASGSSINVVAGVAFNGTLSATDNESNPLTYSKVANPTQGVATVNPNGSYSYTANLNATGQDSFTFKANDGTSDSNVATINITIEPPPPNTPPVAAGAAFEVSRNGFLVGQLQASDADSDPLTYQVVDNVANGLLSVFPSGAFQYSPAPGFNGADSFSFIVNDGQEDSALATVTIMVNVGVPDWVWMKGANMPKQKGTYGTQTEAGDANTPGARSEAASASTEDGLTYVFGGNGFGQSTGPGLLNDFWVFNAETGQWTWLTGGQGINSSGVYGTLGDAGANNTPGARSGAAMWVDAFGDVWLFGGNGRDGGAPAGNGNLNDLWRYEVVSNQWTWMGGSNRINANGTYGTTGQAAAGNVPGARSGAVALVDGEGRFWLFGGRGLGATTNKVGNLNDLWCYNQLSNQWTHIKGSNAIDPAGTYGAFRAGDSTTTPGGRSFASGWVDSEAHLWIFGGNGRAVAAAAGNLNDLWSFDLLTNQWTWESGSSTTNAVGVYGSLGNSSGTTVPGARAGAVSWKLSDGTLLLFGGQGSTGHFNDVWAYDTDDQTWAWVKGPSSVNGAAFYGQLGVPTPSATPGSRRGAIAVENPNGSPMLFGGTNAANNNNDVWMLNAGDVPLIRGLTIANVTATTADYSMSFDPSGQGGELKLYIYDLTDVDNPSEVEVATIVQGAAAGTFEDTFSGLEAGKRYGAVAMFETELDEFESKLVFFSTPGTTPETVTVALVSNSASFGEGATGVTVDLVLSAPAASAFTVPFTLTGTATNGGAAADFTCASSSVSFLPGQVAASIGINIVDDVLIESGAPETIIVTLQNPVGAGAALDSNGSPVHTLSILDNDSGPGITSLAGATIARVGSNVTCSVQFTNPLPAKFQWKRNGVKVAGATQATLVLSAVKAAAAGRYTVDVSNASGTETSPPFDVYVVDATPKFFYPAAGGSVNLSVPITIPAGAPVPGYDWLRNGVTTGIATPTVALTSVSAGTSGTYVCRVFVGTSEGFGGDQVVSVVTEAPVLAAVPEMPVGFVGSPYLYQLPYSNFPQGAATSFTGKNLPAGLKVSATGLVSGTPTAAVTNRTVSFTAKNNFGTSAALNSTITIRAVPAGVIGNYVGVVDRQPSVGDNFGGRVSIATTSAGRFTASLLLGTAAQVQGTGQLNITIPNPLLPNEVEVSGLASFARKGLPPLELSFTLDASGMASLPLEGVLSDASTGGSADVEGYRNLFSKTAPTQAAGHHTFRMSLAPEQVGNPTIPQGTGFAGFTIAADGTVTIVGRTADGASFTTSSIHVANGATLFYVPFTAVPGSLLGGVQVASGNLTGEASWLKRAAPAASKERGYRAGFDVTELEIVGAAYAPPAAGTPLLGLGNNANNASLRFLLPGADTLVTSATFTILPQSATSSVQKITLPNPNPAKLAFKLDAAPVGMFSGSVNIVDAIPALTRSVTFMGMVVRDSTTASSQGVGFHLLPDLPQPGQTVLTSPINSGVLTLGAPVVGP